MLKARKHKNQTHSSFKHWALKHRFFMTEKNADGREATHRLLDGGNLHVPESQEKTFMEKYASDVFMREINYILEVKTPIYKLLVDLDIYENSEISYKQLREWIMVIQSVVKDMYPNLSDEERRVVVCMTETTPNTMKNGKVFVKQGLGHLVWPDIKINNEAGLQFRRCCIQKLEKTFGKRHADNIWEDVIDDTLYKANGLRMLGSSKLSICKHCKQRSKNEPDHSCDTCMGFGRFNEGRVYEIAEIIDGEGQIMQSKLENMSIYDKIVEGSIRCRDLYPTKQTIPSWYDAFHFEYDKEHKNAARHQKQFYEANQGVLTPEDLEGSKMHNISERHRIDPQSKTYKTIKKLITTKMPGVYKHAKILDIHICNSGLNDYYLIRMNTSFCMNVGRQHKSNTIYFVITEFGICQKCFCTCKTLEGRKYNVYCKDFRSAMKSLSAKTKQLLFDGLVTNKVKMTPPGNQLTSQKHTIQEFLKRKRIEIQIRQDFIDGKHQYEERFNSKRDVVVEDH